ncbi:MAG: hypothetical protein ABIK81_04465, partial [candidate division WOR-3 bacterium]
MFGLISLFFLSTISPTRFQIIKQEETRDRFFSENKEYFAQVTHDEGNSEFVPFRSFTLRDEKGNILWHSDNFPYTLVDISNDGWTVGIFFDGPISGKAILNFYDRTGKKRGEGEVDFLNSRAFSENGKIYAVLDGKRGLRIFTREGKELYNLGKGNYFTLSPDGKICALADDQKITFYQDGKKIKSIPIPSPFLRQMKFSSSGRQFGYITKKELFLYRTADWDLVFHYLESEPKWRLISFDLSPENNLVIMGKAEYKEKRKGEVLLFNLNGEMLWREELRYDKWNIFVPEVRFLPGKSFLVKTVE